MGVAVEVGGQVGDAGGGDDGGQGGIAYVMKGDLDAACGQLQAVLTLAPAFRIATITSYLADMDWLLAQRRFAGAGKARELRQQIAAFTTAASPAATGAGENW